MTKETPRQAVIRLLWEKQFEKSPWHDKFHLIRPESLEADYGALADKIIVNVIPSRIRYALAFLEKISGDGYGGTEEYELALAEARDLFAVREGISSPHPRSP